MVIGALKGQFKLAQGKKMRVPRAFSPPWVSNVITIVGRAADSVYHCHVTETEMYQRSYRPRLNAFGTRTVSLGRLYILRTLPRAAAKFVRLTSLCPGLLYFVPLGLSMVSQDLLTYVRVVK